MASTLTISDAARATGVSAHTLRYYERGDETHEARLALLESHRDAVRSHLEETAGSLELIERKIAYYHERLAQR